MTITFGWWVVPVILSFYYGVKMVCAWRADDSPLALLATLAATLYLIPILAAWVAYLAIHAIWGIV